MKKEELLIFMRWKYSHNPNSFEDAFFTAMVDKCVGNKQTNNDIAEKIYREFHNGDIFVPNGDNLYRGKL